MIKKYCKYLIDEYKNIPNHNTFLMFDLKKFYTNHTLYEINNEKYSEHKAKSIGYLLHFKKEIENISYLKCIKITLMDFNEFKRKHRIEKINNLIK